MENLLNNIIVPTLTVVGTIVGVVIYITKRDARHSKNEAVMEVTIKNVDYKLEKMMTNHLPHLDQKINTICDKVNTIDKQLYAHLQNNHKQDA